MPIDHDEFQKVFNLIYEIDSSSSSVKFTKYVLSKNGKIFNDPGYKKDIPNNALSVLQFGFTGRLKETKDKYHNKETEKLIGMFLDQGMILEQARLTSSISQLLYRSECFSMLAFNSIIEGENRVKTIKAIMLLARTKNLNNRNLAQILIKTIDPFNAAIRIAAEFYDEIDRQQEVNASMELFVIARRRPWFLCPRNENDLAYGRANAMFEEELSYLEKTRTSTFEWINIEMTELLPEVKRVSPSDMAM